MTGNGSHWIIESLVKVSVTGVSDAIQALVLTNDGNSAMWRDPVALSGIMAVPLLS